MKVYEPEFVSSRKLARDPKFVDHAKYTQFITVNTLTFKSF